MLTDTELDAVLEKAVDSIFSDETHQTWEMFRQSTHDPALKALDDETYNLHMTAALLQLLGGAFARALGGPQAARSDITGFFSLLGRLHFFWETKIGEESEIHNLYDMYNSAYGSSPTNGAGAMVEVFNTEVCDGKMTQGLKDALLEQWASFWHNQIQDFQRKGVQFKSANGCLSCILLGFVLTITAMAILMRLPTNL